DEAQQIYEIRMQLEASAAAACAQKATPAAIEALNEALAAIAEAHSRHSSIDALRATNTFYEAMFLTGGHTIAWEVVQRLHGRISRLRAMTLASDGRQSAGHAQLSEIVTAIAARDADRAASACRQHVEGAARLADALLAARPG
ncbi:MAG TPA: FCD domain-containing protein, partial [Novosphingobium sp.]|nr:FCD domain-containing protein [Novosphingobium sp.]